VLEKHFSKVVIPQTSRPAS